jgi:hypothetical protein
MHAYTQTEYRAKESLQRALSQPRRLSTSGAATTATYSNPRSIHNYTPLAHGTYTKNLMLRPHPSVVRTISAGNDPTICFRKDQPGAATLSSTPTCTLACRELRSVITSASPTSGFADGNKQLFDPLQMQEKSPLAVTDCGPYNSTNRVVEGGKRVRQGTTTQTGGIKVIIKPLELHVRQRIAGPWMATATQSRASGTGGLSF